MGTAARVKLTDLSEREWKLFATPAAFGETFLGLPLYPKQRVIVNACARHGAQVIARCANEVGKTRMFAILFAWWITVFAKSFAISTAGVYRQVTDQLMPYFKSFAPKFPGMWVVGADSIHVRGIMRYRGFSTNNPGFFEGYHGSEEAPLLCGFDEAKSIKRGIYDAAERCRPQVFVQMSSPGGPSGPFYENCTKHTKLFEQFKITQHECPHIPKDSIERRILKYGAQHPLVRSMIDAEFMDQVEGAVVSLSQFEECVENPPTLAPGARRGFCDFGGGRAENVFALRIGNKVWIADAWREPNEMAAVGRFISNFVRAQKEFGLRAEEIEGDADGIGKPMINRIREAGWTIGYFHGGQAPRFEKHFKNLISEVWCGGAELIKQKKIILPRDEDLMMQMITRRQLYLSDGRIAIESKDDLTDSRREGGAQPSPDRADAVFGAMASTPLVASRSLTDAPNYFPDWPDENQMSVPEEILKGMNAGS